MWLRGWERGETRHCGRVLHSGTEMKIGTLRSNSCLVLDKKKCQHRLIHVDDQKVEKRRQRKCGQPAPHFYYPLGFERINLCNSHAAEYEELSLSVKQHAVAS